eukprot:5602285-Lingulodinium_polyedra.AAC.1
MVGATEDPRCKTKVAETRSGADLVLDRGLGQKPSGVGRPVRALACCWRRPGWLHGPPRGHARHPA